MHRQQTHRPGSHDQGSFIDEELGVVIGRRLGRVLIVWGDSEKDIQARNRMALTLSSTRSDFQPSGLFSRFREEVIRFGPTFERSRLHPVGSVADAMA